MRTVLVVPPHDLLWVTGSDAVSFLDGLVSRSVAAMSPGTVGRALLLTPQGKLEAPLWLLRGDDRVGIAVEGGAGTAVAAALGRFKLRVDAALAADERRFIEVWGDAAADVVEPGRWREDGDRLDSDLPLVHGPMRRVLTTEPVVGVAADPGLAEAVRVAMGEPRLGVDVDGSTIPQEAGLVDGAVDFDKGCYLGQELVARIDSRGHVNRHLRGLLLTAPVAPGSEVVAGGAAVGTVTSAAESPDLGPIGLALLRREVAVGDTVRVGEVMATVSDLPMSASR